MPLTPAEVHNVAFKKPPIGKRGYDEEEVDAFLDIVEVELSRLIEENNDLQGPGRATESTGGATESSDGAPESQPAPTAQREDGVPDEALAGELAGAQDENQRLQSHIAELERALTQGDDGAQQQVVQLQQQLTQTEQQLAESRLHLEQAQQAAAQAQEESAAQAAKNADRPTAAAPDISVQAVQVLALAQQTADQHLSQSKAEAERLLSEANSSAEATLSAAKAKSEKHVGDAEARAKQLDADSTSRVKQRDEESTSRATRTVQDSEQRAATITAQFEQRKSALERRVEELRTFEREYRTRLKSYLESQLRDLDASGRAEPAAPAAQRDGMVDTQQN